MTHPPFLVGDLHTVCLLSARAEVMWLCAPAFDSGSIFASMIDADKGGSWNVDLPDWNVEAAMLPYTAILQSEWSKGEDAFTLQDFFVMRTQEDPASHIFVRRLKGKAGVSNVKMTIDPRPAYGQQRAVFERSETGMSVRIDDRSMWLHLPSSVKTTLLPQKQGLALEVVLKPNEVCDVILEFGRESSIKREKRDLLESTSDAWKDWVTSGMFRFSRQELVRSAINLKLLQSQPTGGILAAPSILEGSDGRIVRLRDAAFGLYAWYVLGFTEEAKKFFHFIETIAEDAKRCDGGTCDLDLSSTYTIWGQPLSGTSILQKMSGMEQAEQDHGFPLDAYGSLIDAYYFMSKRGLPIADTAKEVIMMLARGVLLHWKSPSSGLLTEKAGQYTYGKVMAWVGIDRTLRLQKELSLSDESVRLYEKARTEIAEWIWSQCFDAKKNVLQTSPTDATPDAGAPLYVLLQFLNRHEERTRSILQAHAVLKGLPEYVQYWNIAALSATEKHDEAEKLLQHIETKEMTDHGALSSIGYIMSAYYLHRYAPALALAH